VSLLLERFVARFARGGWVDASSRMAGWAREAGFPGVRDPLAGFEWTGALLPSRIEYLLGFIEPLIPELEGDGDELRAAAASWRRWAKEPGATFRVEIRRLLAAR
jgi:hypothetical protein